ncbi:putative Uncharacterized protein C7orf50 like protein, partial [Fusarium oxysporum f. sp. albedinis]
MFTSIPFSPTSSPLLYRPARTRPAGLLVLHVPGPSTNPLESRPLPMQTPLTHSRFGSYAFREPKAGGLYKKKKKKKKKKKIT